MFEFIFILLVVFRSRHPALPRSLANSPQTHLQDIGRDVTLDLINLVIHLSQHLSAVERARDRRRLAPSYALGCSLQCLGHPLQQHLADRLGIPSGQVGWGMSACVQRGLFHPPPSLPPSLPPSPPCRSKPTLDEVNSIGKRYNPSRCVQSAPSFSRSLTTLREPWWHATCRGVHELSNCSCDEPRSPEFL